MSVYFKELPEYLDAALNSIVHQALLPTELVLVEDGPITDDLSFVINSYRSKLNIVSVVLPVNRGLAYALNEGIIRCKYDLIFRMDSDDYCLPDRFEYQLSFLVNNPSISCVSAFIDEYDSSLTTRISTRRLPVHHIDIVRYLKFGSPINHPVVAYRKDAVLSVGSYPDTYPEDPYLWAKLILSGFKLANIDQTLLYMRAGNNMIKRRGFRFLRGEIKYFIFLLNNDLITNLQFVYIVLSRSLVRISPVLLRMFFYKLSRFYLNAKSKS